MKDAPTRVLWLALACLCFLSIPQVVAAKALDRRPARRIVTLAPSLTELTFAAGAGDRLVGTVEWSNVPEAARRVPRIGDAFRVDMEKLLSLQPDLVLGWEGGTPAALLERIRQLGLRVEIIATYRVADISRGIRRIGSLAGTADSAGRRADEIDAALASLTREYGARPRIDVFIEVDNKPLYTVNGKQLISQVVELCGGRNIFADLGQLAPTIGIEAVVARNPQAIVSTDDTVADARADWARWSSVSAVRAGNIFTLRANDIAQPTTQIVAGIRETCEALDKARANLAGIKSNESRGP